MNRVSHLKQKLANLLEQAVIQAQDEGLIPDVALPEILLEHPQNPEHGDYASAITLKLGRAARENPLGIAKAIVKLLPPIEEVERVWAAAPGFINFRLKEEWFRGQVEEILNKGECYGDLALGRGSKVQLEFVSVNPTGPLHVGHGRGAVIGSTLANVLSAVGYEVEKEYYINDAGSQMQAFYRSLYTRYLEVLGLTAEMPSEGYYGPYVTELAREIVAEKGDAFLELENEEAVREVGQIGFEKVMKSIKDDLNLLGVEFDLWFSEQTLYPDKFDKAMVLLRQEGHTKEEEGAIWFVTTGLGEDNVLVRSSGAPTYFASDIAYHYNKFLERRFDKVIDIWGADHQGHVSRMKAAINALGISPDRLQIIISQMVDLRRGKEQIKFSKRVGEFITLRELIDEVGTDVCRFFFLSRSPDSQMDFDLELAKKESLENPVYYVQYAHARIAGILRLAKERGIDYKGGDVSLLNKEAELDLIKKLSLFPEIMEMVALNFEPHHLTYYAQELATSFHNFYERCRVITQDKKLTLARLKLVEGTRIILAKTLWLMGMSAPERM